MKQYILICILCFILGSCNQTPNDASSDNIIINDNLGSQIDSLLQKEQARGFSGSVLVKLRDSVLLRKGYGWTDSLRSIDVTPSTNFYLASTTKGISGVLALLAQEEGLLQMSDSLWVFYPDCSIDFRNISLNNMLIHTSGLSADYKTFGATERDDNIDLLYNKSLEHKGVFNYSSAGYWFTAAVIEKAAGITYKEYAHKNLFDKLGMEDTKFWFEADEDNRYSFAQKLKKFPPGNQNPNWGYMASGGITTNIIDLELFTNALFSESLLNKETLKQLFGPYLTLASGIGIGYGWYTTTTSRGTTEIWARGGEDFGHNSVIRWFKDENALILLLCNCGTIKGEEYEANRSVSDKIEMLLLK